MKTIRSLMAVLVLLCAALVVPLARQAGRPPEWPGVKGQGVTLLPNGWRIAPAGRAVAAGDFPMSMVLSGDGRYAIASNNGWSKPSLTLIDLQQQYVKARVPVEHAWLGLVWHPSGDRLYSSGAAENTINVFGWKDARLAAAGQISIARPMVQLPAGTTDLAGTGFIGGLAIDARGRTLYAVHVLGRAISAIDLEKKTVRQTVDLPAEPYTVVLSGDGSTLYVSLWGGAKVLALDAATLATKREVAVGEHPNAMTFSKDGRRLFVACANTNKVWVLDAPALAPREQVSVALYPQAPAGTTPNALALSPDGGTLAVANADNNTVALIDVENPAASVVEGFIPTGWYPTAVQFTPDGKRLIVLNGKGLTGQANPRGPQATSPTADGQYAGQLLQGALSIIDVPGAEALKAHTARVYEVTPYSDQTRLAPANAPADSPIPRKVGESSPIKYVFYVIRENRTYDQVLGDLERGNGDPNLAIFGETITPNAHALARDFVTFDNFYVDAEVSYDGHAFSTAAYATDVVEKMWPTNYGRRGGVYTSEGGWGDRNAYGNLSTPADGYIWDFATRAGVSVRSYGEFAKWNKRWGPVEATVPGLRGKVHPSYPPWDLDIPDGQRVDVWLKEFHGFEKSGEPPRLSIIRLGGDHTVGTRAGALTPRAMVAENDLALGRLVEAISKSRFWKESAVFVLEDDAQNGPDHVDSHRSVALVASPFAKRRALDSTLYTTSGVLRTMELILGLPPMSQYDASATPMYNAFRPTPDAAPYTALPARIRLDERNGADAWGAAASLAMNFAEADVTPEYELNEILWKSVRGAHSPMPPPVRAGFIRIIDEEEEEKREQRSRTAPGPAKPVIIAYVFPRNEVMVPSEIAVDKLTHINYAFADIKDGRVVEGFARDAENFKLLAELRRQHPHLQILISVGGWTWSNNFSDAALTAESRRRFTASAIEFVRRHDIDGVDIDWEYPGLRGNNNVHRPEDKENFTAMMLDLRQALDAEGRARNRRYLLTFAAGAFPDFIAKTEMDKVQVVVDFVNLMTYDFRTSDPIAGHHANLYLHPADAKKRSVDSAVRDFIAAGVPPAKVVVGVPFYGRAWADIKGEGTGLYQPGSRPTERIETNYGPMSTTLIDRGGFVRMWDGQAQAPYLWNKETRTFISYDDPESLRLKSAYIRDKGLGGAMFWEYYADRTGVLLDTLFTTLHGPPSATPRTPVPK